MEHDHILERLRSFKSDDLSRDSSSQTIKNVSPLSWSQIDKISTVHKSVVQVTPLTSLNEHTISTVANSVVRNTPWTSPKEVEDIMDLTRRAALEMGLGCAINSQSMPKKLPRQNTMNRKTKFRRLPHTIDSSNCLDINIDLGADKLVGRPTPKPAFSWNRPRTFPDPPSRGSPLTSVSRPIRALETVIHEENNIKAGFAGEFFVGSSSGELIH